MDVLNVVWHEGANSLDNRSRYGIATLLNEAFDFTKQFEFIHRNTMCQLPPDVDEAIVVVHGEHELHQTDQILHDVNRFRRAIVVIIGDDAAMMNTGLFVAPNRKIWQQMSIPSKHNFASRLLICGYPHDAQMHLSPYDAMSVDRPLDWFFAGQVTHVRRRQCVNQLKGMQNGSLVETPGFWQGLDRSEYYRRMSQAKIIPCPSGPVTADTIRVAEALEAGCMPIVDGTCPRPGYPLNYWQYVLGGQPPFPLIYDWNTLPSVIAQELQRWPNNRNIAVEWWKNYKRSMHRWIPDDMAALRRDNP